MCISALPCFAYLGYSSPHLRLWCRGYRGSQHTLELILLDSTTDCFRNIHSGIPRTTARFLSGTLLPFLFWGLLIKTE